MRNAVEIIIVALGIGLVIISVVCFEAWIVMLLWNFLMPALFGLGTATFWQSLALLIFINILTGACKIKLERGK